MKIECEFIGWAISGNSLMYNGVDLMSAINCFGNEIKDRNRYFGIYPTGIPKQEYCGKKVRLTPIMVNSDITIAYTEFTMCYYLFFKVPQNAIVKRK